MADFRKMFFVFAALVMIMAIPASAQISCIAFVSNQPTLRQEGITEPAGDITLTCTVGAGGLSGALTGPQSLSLYVQGTSITSRQLYSGTSAPSSIPTEAALLVKIASLTPARRLTPPSPALTPLPTLGPRLRDSCRTARWFSLDLASRLTRLPVIRSSFASPTFAWTPIP